MIESLFSSGHWMPFLSLVSFVVAYFLGAIPFGLLVARIFRVQDLTSRGSGNIGATNVSRVVGFWPAGVLTFVLDFSKGLLAVLLASPAGVRLIVSLFGIEDLGVEAIPSFNTWMAGFLAVLGHCFSPFLHFRGGKGVATGLGAALVLSPLAAGIGTVGFALAFLHRRTVSLASITGLILTAIAHWVFNPADSVVWIGAAMLFLILIRHEANIDALLENRENTF